MPPSRSQCLHPWELYTHPMQKDSPGSPHASPITGSWQLRALLGPERERELGGFEPRLVLQVGGGQSQGVVRSGSPMFGGHLLVRQLDTNLDGSRKRGSKRRESPKISL